MQPRIIYKPAFSVIGIWRNGNPSSKSQDALWESLGERYGEISNVDPDQGYGVHVKTDTEEKYLAGLRVKGGNPDGKLPAGMSSFNLDAHAYAVFHHFGRLESLGLTLEAIFSTWLPDSGYMIKKDFFFELFDDRFQPDSDDSLLFIYVPIIEKTAGKYLP